jgi:hypothetical protein
MTPHLQTIPLFGIHIHTWKVVVDNSFKFINTMSSKEPILSNFFMSREWLHGWKISNKQKIYDNSIALFM